MLHIPIIITGTSRYLLDFFGDTFNNIMQRVTSGVLFSIDQSAMSLLNLNI